VLALAELVLAHPSARIDEVQGRPVLVFEGAPDRVIVVNHDRIFDPHLPHGTPNVVEVLFEPELGCVHADQDEAVAVLLRPGAKIGKRPQPVDAGIGPEIDEYDLPRQARTRERGRIEPLGRTAESGQLAGLALSRSGGAEHPETGAAYRHRRPPEKAPAIVVD